MFHFKQFIDYIIYWLSNHYNCNVKAIKNIYIYTLLHEGLLTRDFEKVRNRNNKWKKLRSSFLQSDEILPWLKTIGEHSTNDVLKRI